MSATSTLTNLGNSIDMPDNVEEIYAWIDQMSFSRPKRNISRDFSDAVLMAELLKKYYPRYVDVHNYISGNSVAKKIDNWTTLNRKVLRKIDLKLSKEVINQLATSQQGSIEKVLNDLRSKILNSCITERDSMYCEQGENGRGETVGSLLNPDEVANKSIPRHIYTKVKQELQERNEAIHALERKVLHLESLIKLKDQRISDLSTQLMGSTESAQSTMPHITNSSFLQNPTSKI